MSIGKVLLTLYKNMQLRYRSKKYRAGTMLSCFVACDIRRDIKVEDASEVDKGYLTIRSRTWNVLYAIKGIAPIPDFSEPKRMEVDRIWHWAGPAWGGPVPYDNSTNGRSK